MWGATLTPLIADGIDIFQLTLPVWGATKHQQQGNYNASFQLTLPVWGATAAVAL